MDEGGSRLQLLLAELRRRKVFRVAIVYAAVAFVIWQIAEIAVPGLNLPNWVLTLIILLTALGFPIAVGLAWAFDITPAGVKRTESETAAVEGPTVPSVDVVAERKSIVVLPFDNMSPDPADAYLSDGLTEEIITGLSCCGPLRVISRNSARALKGTQKDTRTIARELDVQYVLEGSVRKAGNDLRITAQLIDGRTDEHLWSERYSGTLDDVFDMQERISCSIVDALMLKLSPEEERRLKERPIDNVQAYECYLRARQEIWLFTKDATDRARQHLQNGLEIIGENALLLAGMGYVYAQYANIGVVQGDLQTVETLGLFCSMMMATSVFHDPLEARWVVEALTAPHQPAQVRAVGHAVLAYLEAARGRWSQVDRELAEADRLYATGAGHRAYSACFRS